MTSIPISDGADQLDMAPGATLPPPPAMALALLVGALLWLGIFAVIAALSA